MVKRRPPVVVVVGALCFWLLCAATAAFVHLLERGRAVDSGRGGARLSRGRSTGCIRGGRVSRFSTNDNGVREPRTTLSVELDGETKSLSGLLAQGAAKLLEAQRALDSTQAQLEAAETALAETRRELAEQKTIAVQEVLQATSSLAEMSNKLTQSEVQLQRAQLVAARATAAEAELQAKVAQLAAALKEAEARAMAGELLLAELQQPAGRSHTMHREEGKAHASASKNFVTTEGAREAAAPRPVVHYAEVVGAAIEDDWGEAQEPQAIDVEEAADEPKSVLVAAPSQELLRLDAATNKDLDVKMLLFVAVVWGLLSVSPGLSTWVLGVLFVSLFVVVGVGRLSGAGD